LLTLLLLLTIAEIYFFTAFLPATWQHAINYRMTDILSSPNDWSQITHPALNHEIDQVLHDNVGLRIALYALTIGLLVGNVLLIRAVWRRLRGAAGPAQAIR
jgi:hypothetical protein